MRTPSTSLPHTQGPNTTSPQFEKARRRFLAARHQLTCVALEELIVGVGVRYSEASGMLFICDDVEDGLHLAEVTDRTGASLSTGGPLLDERTTAQVLGNICGTDLAAVDGVRQDPAAMRRSKWRSTR